MIKKIAAIIIFPSLTQRPVCGPKIHHRAMWVLKHRGLGCDQIHQQRRQFCLFDRLFLSEATSNGSSSKYPRYQTNDHKKSYTSKALGSRFKTVLNFIVQTQSAMQYTSNNERTGVDRVGMEFTNTAHGENCYLQNSTQSNLWPCTG